MHFRATSRPNSTKFDPGQTVLVKLDHRIRSNLNLDLKFDLVFEFRIQHFQSNSEFFRVYFEIRPSLVTTSLPKAVALQIELIFKFLSLTKRWPMPKMNNTFQSKKITIPSTLFIIFLNIIAIFLSSFINASKRSIDREKRDSLRLWIENHYIVIDVCQLGNRGYKRDRGGGVTKTTLRRYCRDATTAIFKERWQFWIGDIMLPREQFPPIILFNIFAKPFGESRIGKCNSVTKIHMGNVIYPFTKLYLFSLYARDWGPKI